MAHSCDEILDHADHFLHGRNHVSIARVAITHRVTKYHAVAKTNCSSQPIEIRAWKVPRNHFNDRGVVGTENRVRKTGAVHPQDDLCVCESTDLLDQREPLQTNCFESIRLKFRGKLSFIYQPAAARMFSRYEYPPSATLYTYRGILDQAIGSTT